MDSPYSTLPTHDLTRVSASVSAADLDLIRGIRPQSGTMNDTLAHLIHKLAHALRKRSIYDSRQREQFERFVSECELTEPIKNKPCRDITVDDATRWETPAGNS